MTDQRTLQLTRRLIRVCEYRQRLYADPPVVCFGRHGASWRDRLHRANDLQTELIDRIQDRRRYRRVA